MASGKKGKKTKGKTVTLTDFLQDTSGPMASVPIRKSNTNWADEVEDSYDGYESRYKVNVVLPTAPKASRDFDDIEAKVPKEGPYWAYLSNLPYDLEEEDIIDFFKNQKIVSMKIPKDDRVGEGQTKLKGFGYVEFEDRESLINALVIPDTMLKSRRIRIEVAENFENDRRRGRMDMGRDRPDRGDSMGDWRSGPRAENHDSDRRGFSRDNRDRDGGFSRDNRDGGGFNRDREGGFRRERDGGGFTRENRDRDGGSGFTRGDRDNNRDDERQGSWRDNERLNRNTDSGRTFGRRNYESDRGRFDERDDNRRGGGGGFGNRRYDNDRNGKDDQETAKSVESRQRPKLNLAPRTKPVEPTTAPESVPSASIFGAAKPVDTSLRERQIEEKLLKEQDKPRDASKERKTQPEETERKNIERSRPVRKTESPTNEQSTVEIKRATDEDKKVPPKNENNEKPRNDKAKRDERKERHDKEMPKVKEPEPPNFAANNKFAYLETEDSE